jgi:CMP-N-acetylneuraminic acid synthetase
MVERMSAVCIIPARGGSRRIPKKNIKEFFGKPIIEYSIDAAKKAEIFKEIIVSTDSNSIMEAVDKIKGITIHLRSSLMARDEIGTQEVMKNVLEPDEADFACCLYPCVPMLEPYELHRALSFLRFNSQIQYVVPVGKWLEDPGRWYFGRSNAFKTNIPLIGMGTRLMEVDERKCVDINTMDDWREAEARYEDLYL